MNARGIAAVCLSVGVLILSIAVRSFAEAMVKTWSPELTVMVLTFAGVAVIIVAIGFGSGVRLALQDRRETARPIIVQPPTHAGLLSDPLRDAERMQRILQLGARGENGRVPAFEVGPYVDYGDGPE